MQLRIDALDRLVQLVARASERVSNERALASHRIGLYTDYKAAHQAIRKRLEQPGEGLPVALLWSLGRPIEIMVGLNRCPPETHKIFRGLHAAVRQVPFVVPLEAEEAWVEAFAIVQHHNLDSGMDLYSNMAGSRGFAVARSLQRLEARGYKMQINSFGAALTDDAFSRACSEIERLIRRLGGANVANSIFGALDANGKVFRGLFLYGRTVSQINQLRDPSVPWHFLYNLALKYLRTRPEGVSPEQDWNALIELASDVGASIDVEEYSAYAWMSISPYLIERAVLDNTLYDELFSFQQWSAEGAGQVFAWWLEALVEADCSIPIATAAEWKEIGQSLIAKSQPCALCLTLPLEHGSIRVSAQKTRQMMVALSMPSDKINEGYRTPLQTEARDAPFYPLLKVGGDGFVLQPRGLAARALYERLCAMMRDVGDRGLADKLGLALELLAEKVLRAAGQAPSVVRQKYWHPTSNKKYEIDLALESDDQIVLIECKMKALTRAARSTATVQALVDLTKSFLAALLQAIRHEIALRSVPSLQLEGGGVISLNGRSVERIVLTMLDHGSLQNRLFIRNIVRAFFGAKLNSDDAGIADALTHINEGMVELQGYFTQLATLTGLPFEDFLRRHEFGTWWLSVDQLALITRGTPGLLEGLSPIRNVTFQTGDLMNELAYALRMRAAPNNQPSSDS